MFAYIINLIAEEEEDEGRTEEREGNDFEDAEVKTKQQRASEDEFKWTTKTEEDDEVGGVNYSTQHRRKHTHTGRIKSLRKKFERIFSNTVPMSCD